MSKKNPAPKTQPMIKPYTRKLYLIVLSLTIAAFTAEAQTIIAQEKGYINGWYDGLSNFGGSNQDIGQTFKAGATATIATIEFYIASLNSAGDVNIEIYSCSSPTNWGSLLNTKTNVHIGAAGWVVADVTALHVSLTAGNYYGFKLIPQNGLQGGIGMNSNLYPDGQSYIYNNGGYDAFDIGEDYPFSITAGSLLPVTLASFTARKQSNNVLLQWATATEQNSKDFSVQYSANGNSWNTISILSAAGNSNTIRHYSYTHTNPAAGNNYYRLLQTDIDGKSSYSEVRNVSFSTGASSFKVMTNPVRNSVLQVEVNSAVPMSLYSPDGRLLWEKQMNTGLQSIDISRYGKGIFLLKTKEATEKILVQ
jgi:hypothetical protein